MGICSHYIRYIYLGVVQVQFNQEEQNFSGTKMLYILIAYMRYKSSYLHMMANGSILISSELYKYTVH